MRRRSQWERSWPEEAGGRSGSGRGPRAVMAAAEEEAAAAESEGGDGGDEEALKRLEVRAEGRGSPR